MVPLPSGFPDGRPGLAECVARSTRVRSRRWPCFGIAPVALSLAVALPLAAWAKGEGRTPARLVCSTARGDASEPPCAFRADRNGAAWTSLACEAAPLRLAGALHPSNPLVQPRVSMAVSPLEEDGDDDAIPPTCQRLRATPSSGSAFTARGTMISGVDFGEAVECIQKLAMRVGTPRGRMSSQELAPSDPSAARAAVEACAASSGTGSAPGRVSVAVVADDYTRSVLVVLGSLVVALLLMLRRWTDVEVDRTAEVAHVVERGYFGVRSARTVTWRDGDGLDGLV